jgi:tripartite-type tricarboxylate transporter receptor subunit TctC
VSTQEQRQIRDSFLRRWNLGGYFAPPTVQQERIDILRTAFAAVHADPEFRAEAESLHIDVTYRPPAALQKLVNEMFATPKARRASKEIMPAAGD